MSDESAFKHLSWSLAVTYVVVAASWILGSAHIVDPVAGRLGWSAEQVEVGKGLLFVAVTGLLLLVSVRWFAARLGVEQRAWAALADATRDGLLLYKIDADARTRLRVVNDAMLLMGGLESDEVARDPRRVLELLPEEHAAAVRRAEVDGGVVQRSLELTSTSGDRRWVRLSVTTLQQRRACYVQMVLVDLEEERARERALQETLEVQRAARMEAERHSQLRASFLTAVSHELRTPVTVVTGLAETLYTHRERMDDRSQARAETALLGQARRLRATTIDLLDIDRYTAGGGTTRFDRHDLAALLHATCSASAIAGRLTVTAPQELAVTGDAALLRRLIDNLLSNVHKYAPDGPVDVRLSSEDGLWQLEVADAGPGVPEEELERMFEPFHRLDEQHPQPGTGVGLALVREFARAHGGEVRATLGRGLNLIVTAPTDAGATAAVDGRTTPIAT